MSKAVATIVILLLILLLNLNIYKMTRGTNLMQQLWFIIIALLHPVGTSRHFHIWCTVTHTSNSFAPNRPKMLTHTRTP